MKTAPGPCSHANISARSRVWAVGVEEKARLKHDLQCVWTEGAGSAMNAVEGGIRGGMADSCLNLRYSSDGFMTLHFFLLLSSLMEEGCLVGRIVQCVYRGVGQISWSLRKSGFGKPATPKMQTCQTKDDHVDICEHVTFRSDYKYPPCEPRVHCCWCDMYLVEDLSHRRAGILSNMSSS